MASITGLGKIGLPGNQDQPGGTAVQTAPFQSGGNAPTQTCAPFNSTQSFQLIGSGILYQMQEQLQYVLSNLDTENLSEELRTRLQKLP